MDPQKADAEWGGQTLLFSHYQSLHSQCSPFLLGEWNQECVESIVTFVPSNTTILHDKLDIISWACYLNMKRAHKWYSLFRRVMQSRISISAQCICFVNLVVVYG